MVGGNAFVTGRETGATAVTVTGYPSTLDAPITCTNKPTVHSRTQQRIECPAFAGGTSGSPWVNGEGEVVGVIGGHEAGRADTDDISYSVVSWGRGGRDCTGRHRSGRRGSAAPRACVFRP